MKKCISCGNSLDSATKFCNDCGAKQPDLSQENQNPTYSASIGDKNVISGNIIGKSEEFNITGPATINKIEDDTKKFITCAVSGKHLLRGRDIVINCPKCKLDVSQESFNLMAGRCLNCDKIAQQQYSDNFEKFFTDGRIDPMERMQLDSLALSLMLDSQTKQILELEAKKQKESLNATFNDNRANELSGFHKIQYKKALTALFDDAEFDLALSILNKVHNDNLFNEEVAALYYVVKAVNNPNDYINDYEKVNTSNIDIYWKDYWAFLPYLLIDKEDEAFKIIKGNKARFSDNHNDILLSEVVSFLILYVKTSERDWLTEAKSLYAAFGRNLKQPLHILQNVLEKVLNTDYSEWHNISAHLNTQERFYFNLLTGFKQANLIERIQQNNELKPPVIESEINRVAPVIQQVNSSLNENQEDDSEMLTDENGNIWIDKISGLLLRDNHLLFVNNGVELKTLITDKVIWLTSNYSTVQSSESIDFPNMKNNFLPKNWHLPGKADWNLLSAFIAAKNGESHAFNSSNTINIGGIECKLGDKLVCINDQNTNVIKEGRMYFLAGFTSNGINLYDIDNNDFLYQPNSKSLAAVGAKRFQLELKWTPGEFCPDIHDCNFSFLHPKYKVANKFGINYKESFFAMQKTEGLKGISGLEITKNDSVKFYKEVSNELALAIRIYTPLTNQTLVNLKKHGYILPEYLNFSEIETSKLNTTSKVVKEMHTSDESKSSVISVKSKNTVISVESKSMEVKKEIKSNIEINGKLWCLQFLNTTKFRTGKSIPIVTESDQWLKLCNEEKPAMCYYQNDNTKHALYNRYAIISAEGIATEGFYLPEEADISEELIASLPKFNLPKGIRKMGTNPQTGKYHNEFANEMLIGTSLELGEDLLFLEGEYDDYAGCYVIDKNDGLNGSNGYWGLPLLLIKKEL